MVFKLVRTDTEEPCKIQLPLGVHLIGRGKFLDCDDKRVSRKHGELEVTDDAISIKALHQNPCFYIKKGSAETEILKQNCTVTLLNGDKFGLLPESCWYELLHCTLDAVNEDECTQRLEEQETQANDQTIAARGLKTNGIEDTSADEELLNIEMNESIGPSQGSESQSLIPETELSSGIQGTETIGELQGSLSFTPKENSPSTIPNTSSTVDYQLNVVETEQKENVSPQKRCHSPQGSEEDVKRVKLEPGTDDVKQEPGSPDARPGPSGDQRNAASYDSANSAGGMPASPGKPNAQVRERCMYGANCYRKNPSHKAQFAHPSDADWGGGARGRCPWGRACCKRDPRHWRDHDHPPGARAPLPATPGMQVVQRHGNIFYINAHNVYFYDDHVQVEDSDGDSVDYDYEF